MALKAVEFNLEKLHVNQEKVSKNDQFNIFKTKSIFQGATKIDSRLKVDGKKVNIFKTQRSLKNTKNTIKEIQFDPQQNQSFQELKIFGKKSFLKNSSKKHLKDRKTEELHSQITNAINESNHQYPIIILNKVTEAQLAEKNANIQKQAQEENDLNQASSTSKEPTSEDSGESQANSVSSKNDSPLSNYEYSKDYLYSDPYYVRHPIRFNPYDKFNFLSKQKTPEPSIKITEIPTLLEVLDFIGHIYLTLFEALPTQNQNHEKKGNLERTMDVLRFYVKIRSFIQLVVQQRDQLIQDLNFISGKIHLLKFDTQSVINFYNLEGQYFKVQLKEVSYSNDIRMKSYLKDLAGLVEKFGQDARIVLQNGYELGRFTELFLQEVLELQRTESSVPAFQVLITFDKIIMLTIKLLENKMSIQRSIHGLKTSLQKLKDYRLAIEETFYNILNFENEFKVEDTGVQKSVSRTWIILTLLIVLI